MKQSTPYRRPTSVGENPVAGAAILFACVTAVATTLATSEVVAYMTDRVKDPMFAGTRLLFAWATWACTTTNVPNGFYVPHQHLHHLTAFGWQVMHAIPIALGIGATIGLFGFVTINRIIKPKSKQDVSEIKDSARMATIADLRKGGFLAQ